VTCPAGNITAITASARGGGKASFRPWCAACPLPDAERGELLGDLEVVLERVRRAVAESA
jgi:hypothetical protein